MACDIHREHPATFCFDCRLTHIPDGVSDRDLLLELYKKLGVLEYKVDIIADQVISEDHRDEDER